MIEDINNQIQDLITHEIGEAGQAFSLGKFHGIGWIQYPEGSNLDPSDYPLIALKKYEKSVNLYAYLWDTDPVYYKHLESIFGKSAMGKSCIRIKKLNHERIQAIVDILNRLK